MFKQVHYPKKRLIKLLQNEQKIEDVFQITKLEKISQIEQEFYIKDKILSNNENLISIHLEDLDSQTIEQIEISQDTKINLLKKNVNQDNQHIFYFGSIRLLTNLELARYGIQNSEKLQYQKLEIIKEDYIQLLIQWWDQEYQKLIVKPEYILEIVRQRLRMNCYNNQERQFCLYLHNSRLKEKYSIQQLGIRNGDLIRLIPHLKMKLNQNQNFNYSLLLKFQISLLSIEIDKFATPNEIVAQLQQTFNIHYSQLDFQLDNSLLDREKSLCQQGVQNDHVLQAIEQIDQQYDIVEKVKNYIHQYKLNENKNVEIQITEDTYELLSTRDGEDPDTLQYEFKKENNKDDNNSLNNKNVLSLTQVERNDNDIKIIIKPGLIVQVKCQNQKCQSYNQKQYIEMGLGIWNYNNLKDQELFCRLCKKCYLIKTEFGVWQSAYQICYQQGNQLIEEKIVGLQLLILDQFINDTCIKVSNQNLL